MLRRRLPKVRTRWLTGASGLSLQAGRAGPGSRQRAGSDRSPARSTPGPAGMSRYGRCQGAVRSGYPGQRKKDRENQCGRIKEMKLRGWVPSLSPDHRQNDQRANPAVLLPILSAASTPLPPMPLLSQQRQQQAGIRPNEGKKCRSCNHDCPKSNKC